MDESKSAASTLASGSAWTVATSRHRAPPPPLSPPRLLPPLPSAPAVIILRGVSGSGKSNIAKHYQSLALASQPSAPSTSPPSLSASPHRSLVCSADSFFLRHGRYAFDSKLLPQAHSACLASFLALLGARSPYAIVDNTNIQRWEYDNYASVAQLLGYAVLVVEVAVEGEDEVRACSERNVHAVAYSGCQSMADRLEADSRAVKVLAEWTDAERRRMAQRKRAREQAQLRWQATQQVAQQSSEQQQPWQQQAVHAEQQLMQPMQQSQQHRPHFSKHYAPQPRNNQPYYSHAPHTAAEPAAEQYQHGRSRDGRGRGRGGWRGGGISRGAEMERSTYTAHVASNAAVSTQRGIGIAKSSNSAPITPTHTIRWMPVAVPASSAATVMNSASASSPTTPATALLAEDATVSIALVSAPDKANKRYVID